MGTIGSSGMQLRHKKEKKSHARIYYPFSIFAVTRATAIGGNEYGNTKA